MEELTTTVPEGGMVHSEARTSPDVDGDNKGPAADLDIPLGQRGNDTSSDFDGISQCQVDSSNLLSEKASKKSITVEKYQAERRVGYASIKKEFLIENYKPKLHTEYLNPEMRKMMESSKQKSNHELDTVDEGDNTVTKRGATETSNAEPPAKKSKLKGRNKHRPRNERISEKDKLCPAIKGNRECRYGDKCKFSHDKDEFMKKKLPELDGPCHNFDTFGYCHFGLACRFAKNHISPDLQNIVNSELFDKAKVKKPLNDLNGDVRNKLWKKKYNFSKADKAVKEVQKIFRGWNVKDNEKPAPVDCKQSNADNFEKLATSVTESSSQDLVSVEGLHCVASDSTGQPSVAENSPNGEKLTIENVPEIRSLGTITDEELIPLRPPEKVKIDFRNKLYLAPLTTVGNLPFRRVCKDFGAEITCGEMALVPPLLKAKQSEWSLIKRHPCEDIFGVQICGSYPDQMTRCTQLLTETCDVDFIDINCGCPIDMVYKKGGGSALMGKATKLEQICRSMLGVMGDKPLTVKVRTGVFDYKNVAHTLIPRLRDAGVSMVTIHGRSREQRYTKSADWKYIGQCASLGAPMPVFGNGDILSYEDANAHREQSGVSGVMVARGALIKPWIFTEIKEQRHWDISSGERFDILKTYTNYGLEHWGSDHQGVENTRRFLLEWLSFLHRYIPVGVLEQPPQRINERPPYYVGRNELETLMASANCADWIKISEMLLGPVPPSFQFLPKHKANAYQ